MLALALLASLQLVASNPVAVHGSGFRPHERVVVKASVAGVGTARATVFAGKGGAFRVRLPTLHVRPCSAYTLSATGSLGSRAGRRVVPECAPQG